VRKFLALTTAAAGLAGMTTTASAQPPMGFKGQVAFGYLSTTGNSENENMNLSFGGQYDREKWHHALNGLAVKASSSNTTTAEAYGLAWKSNYDLSAKSYLFGTVAWDQDKFSAYDQQTREVFGYGRHFIDLERHKLNGEAGIGFRQADLRSGLSQNESIARLGAQYQWLLSDTARFSQVVAIESGSSNTHSEWVSSLKADIMKKFAIVLSYTVKNNSTVPTGIEKRDTFTAISLQYSF
jgi:putative salt-induced outer membrane protein